MSTGPEPKSLSPMRIVLLLAGLAIVSALSYYRLAEKTPEPPGRPFSLSGETMGTTYSIKLIAQPRADLSYWEFRIFQFTLQSMLALVDDRMSTYKLDSELSRFNTWTSSEPFEISQQMAAVMSAALEVSDQSAGAFDITVGPIVNAYGFGPEERTTPPDEEELAALRERVGYEMLTIDPTVPAISKARPDIYCDLSAIAKGYAADVMAQMLERRRITDYFIEIGGEVRARGRNERGEIWTVGIEKPLEKGRAVHRAVPLEDFAMATSGDYRNYYEENGARISHTIDARTGRPITHNLASVTVFHKQCMMADAYATAIMVLGPEDGYLMAKILNLPVLFLVRGPGGTFSERSTPAFEERFGAAR